MTRIFATLYLLASAMPVQAADPPKELYGHSVVVTWSDARVQRNAGDKDFRPNFGNQILSIYVSTGGRVFNRLTSRTGLGAGSTDQIAGDRADRVPSFDGRSMSILMPFRSGGAIRVEVQFSSVFSDCSASVAYQAPPDGKPSLGFSPITKKWIEFQSIIPLDPKCVIEQGNVFGNN